MKNIIHETAETLKFESDFSKQRCSRTAHNIVTGYTKEEVKMIMLLLAGYVEADIKF